MNEIKIGVMRLPMVIQHVGLSRSTIYLLIKRGQFPKPVQLSLRAVAWRQADIEEWLISRKILGSKEAT